MKIKKYKNIGFTLVEVVIALVLFLLVASSLFLMNKLSKRNIKFSLLNSRIQKSMEKCLNIVSNLLLNSDVNHATFISTTKTLTLSYKEGEDWGAYNLKGEFKPNWHEEIVLKNGNLARKLYDDLGNIKFTTILASNIKDWNVNINSDNGTANITVVVELDSPMGGKYERDMSTLICFRN